MCITVNPASLTKTKILSLALDSGNHFIAYSNKVKNLSGKPNAMILPIPGETKQEFFYDTTKYKGFMDEIVQKCDFVKDYLGMQSRSKGIRSLDQLSHDSFVIGMYKVGLAKNFEGIQDFINSLAENERPEISTELQEFFKEKYAGWSFAICVFDTDKTIDAQPIAFKYAPFDDKFLYFPTMDGHDGKAPSIDSMVDVDHTFIYEHTGSMDGIGTLHKKFVTISSEVPAFLQDRKYRMISLRDRQKNGDTLLSVEAMNNSKFSEEPKLKRISPVALVAM